MSYHYNSELGDFIDPMYAIELEKKDTTDIARYTSFIGIHPEIDSDSRIRMKPYDMFSNFLL
jgi:hypothetical protein